MRYKIGIEVDDKNTPCVDLSHPENGNTGVGGSTHGNILLAYMLSTFCDDKYIVTVYHTQDTIILPEKCFSVVNKYEDNLVVEAAERKEDIYICNMNRSKDWYASVARLDISIVIWSHCYIEKIDEYRAMIKLDQIKRVVCVSHEECDFFYDSEIHKKMTVIHPALPNNYNKWKTRDANAAFASKNVTYIGSLVPQKGFGILASVWPQIVKRVPDAKLIVIGSGKLYDRNQKLGVYGIAEDSFEKSFMKYLTDENGNILESVRFCGLVDAQEKDKLMTKSSVGVVNPSAKTETCCMCAVEFESVGVPVVSKRLHGLVETVVNRRTGLLSYSRRALVRNIVKLLSDKDINIRYGSNAISFAESFVPEKLVLEWESCLDSIYNHEENKELSVAGNYLNDRKWIKCINRFLRRSLNISILPAVFEWDCYIMSFAHSISRLFRVHINRKK